MAKKAKKRGMTGWAGTISLCILICIGGCSKTGSYVDEAQQFSTSLAEQVDAEYSSSGQREGTAKDNHSAISFIDATLRAAHNDRNISSMLGEMEQADIDVRGAATHIWPRLNLGGNAEIPLEGGDDSDVDLTGGVFLNYDIRRAIATADEVTLRRANVQKNISRLKLAINELQKRLNGSLNQVEYLSYRAAQQKIGLDIVQDAYSLAKVYAEQGRIGLAALAGWKKKVAEQQGELENSLYLLDVEKFRLADTLGFGFSMEIRIDDQPPMIEQDELAKVPISAKSVWNRHGEARLYELELIASEAAVKLAELDRLPQFSAELGLGDIPLESSDDNSSTLLRLSLSMPIVDLGDNSRNIAKSKIKRDRLKHFLKTSIARLFNRARLSRSGCVAAWNTLDMASSAVDEARKIIKKRKILVAQSRSDNLDLFQDKLNLIELQIKEKQADIALKNSIDDFRLAIGEDIYPNSIDEIVKNL